MSRFVCFHCNCCSTSLNNDPCLSYVKDRQDYWFNCYFIIDSLLSYSSWSIQLFTVDWSTLFSVENRWWWWCRQAVPQRKTLVVVVSAGCTATKGGETDAQAIKGNVKINTMCPNLAYKCEIKLSYNDVIMTRWSGFRYYEHYTNPVLSSTCGVKCALTP